MPIFTSSSHVQITGGNFIEVGRDFNVEATQPLVTGNVDDSVRGLDFDLARASRPLMSAETIKREGGMTMVPYGASDAVSRVTWL